jgi:predicted transcriptional regulator
MEKKKIKEKIHKLIEEIEDEGALQMLYDDAVEYTTQEETDEELSEEQWASIQRGLKQIEDGETYTHEEVMQHLMEWRSTK